MTTSALVRHGRDYSRVLLDGLDTWLTRKGFTSVNAARGRLAEAEGAARALAADIRAAEQVVLPTQGDTA